MLDPETFLTELYVAVDEFCKAQPPAPRRPGPAPSLTPSEVVTLALYARWGRFGSERAFHRHACARLRPLFPRLPSYPQFNRLVRRCHAAIARFALRLGRALAADDRDRAFEAIDGTGLATRNAKRRGRGWLPGQADIGWCTRVGWYEGVRLLLAVTPGGAITGWGIGAASTNDRLLADTFFAARAAPHPGLPTVGRPTSDCYVADTGFAGARRERGWAEEAGAAVVCPPQSGSKRAWPKPLRAWLAGLRQVVEAVNDRLLFAFGLDRARPHRLSGLQARLAAAAGLHNFCGLLNRRLGRGLLQIADLVTW